MKSTRELNTITQKKILQKSIKRNLEIKNYQNKLKMFTVNKSLYINMRMYVCYSLVVFGKTIKVFSPKLYILNLFIFNNNKREWLNELICLHMYTCILSKPKRYIFFF